MGANEAAACDAWASPSGHDSAPGTSAAPVRTVRTLLARLDPGEVGCLAGGATFTEAVWIRTRGIELRSPPERRAVIRGGITIARGARDVRLSFLVVRNASARRYGVIDIRDSGARVVRSDISGLGTTNRPIHCVLVGRVTGTVIDRNTIHNCTRATTRRLYTAGVRLVGSVETRVSNNFVYHVVGDGIALAGARRSLVHHNVVDGNVSGIGLSAGAHGNRVVDNIVSYSGQFGVHSSVRGTAGPTNVVSANCIWRAFGSRLAGAGRGFRAVGNLVADPRYVARPRTYRMLPGPCFAKRPRSTYPYVRRFTVQYRLLGYPRLVKIVRLRLLNLTPGALVETRCERGCSASLQFRAGPGDSAVLSRLSGISLQPGAIIAIRARRPGHVGHLARIVVTGLPHGIAVQHRCLPPGPAWTPIDCNRYRL